MMKEDEVAMRWDVVLLFWLVSLLAVAGISGQVHAAEIPDCTAPPWSVPRLRAQTGSLPGLDHALCTHWPSRVAGLARARLPP